jgi:deoxyribonuclease-4
MDTIILLDDEDPPCSHIHIPVGIFKVSDIVREADSKSLKKVLPRVEWKLFKDYETKRFPKCVYENKCFAHFGFFVDLLIRCVLYQEFRESCDISQSPEQSVLQKIASGTSWRNLLPEMVNISRIPMEPSLPEKLPGSIMSLLNKIARDTKIMFENIKDKLMFSKEIISGNIMGHPDVFDSESVVEFKAISKPSTNGRLHFAQVASYAALLRDKGMKINHISIFYALHKEQKIVLDIKDWDHKPLLTLLSSTASKMGNSNFSPLLGGEEYNKAKKTKANKQMMAIENSPCNTEEELHFRVVVLMGRIRDPLLGNHIHGVGMLLDSIGEQYNKPVQAFLSHCGTFPKYDCELIKRKLHERKLTAYCHLPYYINLVNPSTSKYPDPIESLFIIIEEIKLSSKLGFHGCVIHCGKNIGKLNYTYKEAWDKMKHYTLWILVNVEDSKCPLLLETPASQGTEMLGDIMEYIRFYREIIAEYPAYYRKVKNKESNGIPFGLCIDTCHVYASGYDPIDYLLTVECELGKAINLIHFNDSLEPKGSKKDRHFCPGMGYIGAAGLLPVYQWALSHNIPMVIE